MNQEKNKGAEYDFYGKLPLQKAILLGLQHVFAMFVGNLTPVLIITGACGIASGTEFADVQIALLQNAMLIAGIVTRSDRSVEKFQSSWERVQDLSVSAAVLHLLWVVESLDMVRSWVLPLSVGYLNQY